MNDHLAGAIAGTELARRLVRTEGEWAGNGRLERLAEEIAADRDTLREIMATLNQPERPFVVQLGWGLEKLARLKRNGRTVRRSPLSRIIELESMRLAVEGKIAGWRALRARAAVDPRLDANRLDELISNGRSQVTRLERLRARAVAESFGAQSRAISGRGQANKAAAT